MRLVLIIAICDGTVPMAKYLIEAGADLTFADINSETALDKGGVLWD